MSIEISYKGNVIASVEDGKKAIVRCNDDKMKGDIEVVSTSTEIPTQEKTIDITENGTVVIEPDAGYALSKATATVNVPKEGVNKLQLLVDAKNGNGSYLLMNMNVENADTLLDGIDTSSLTRFGQFFQNCTNLTTVPLFDTSNGITMDRMFFGCRKLTSVPLYNTSKSGSTSAMFSGCGALTEIPLFDMSNVSDASSMFQSCDALTVVPALDLRNATITSIVNNCKSLTECWVRNFYTNLQVGSGTSWGHLLTLESLLHLCKECRKTRYSRTLTMGDANLAKLEGIYVKLIDITDEMRAEDDLIDEKYPFVQCESTDEGAMTIQEYMATKMWSLA